MTVRLVALIGFVLLLCLAAFGFLVNHYQQQVMDEVARTASAVGRATLRTLEWRERFPDAEQGLEVERHMQRRIAGGSLPRRLEAIVVARAETERQPRDRVTAAADRIHEGSVTREPEPPDAGVAAEVHGEVNVFVIDVDEVRAERDPAAGLVLKIPKLTPTAGSGGFAYGFRHAAGEVEAGSAAPSPGVLLARHDEIRLPIPTGDFAELFRSLRTRSLLLAAAIFGVGMLLATALAARFTRPVRRLDAGIRRLAEGDLDVEVPVEGRGEVARLSRTFNDMARRLRASRERSRELVRREKLSALGRLAAGVAHDVRNPLHSIGLTLQHLSETTRPDEAARGVEFDRCLDVIRGEVRRLDRLVGNFLGFAASERRMREPVDLAALLEETARLVSKEAEWRGIEVRVEPSDAVPPVEADAEALRSAVLNLVLNAFDAMPGGGRLVLALRAEEGGVVLEVSDTGEGIPPEDHERVFDFAYTTRERGSGLGLAMVHHCVVEEHGGRVRLDSTPGQGTRVIAILPPAAAAASAS